jgi:hypothetical protein
VFDAQLPRRSFAGLAASILLVGVLGFTPQPTRADFCGGTMTITPRHGPVGTTFKVTFSVGGPTLVHFFHRNVEVQSVPKPDGIIRMRILAHDGDEGHWRVRAAYVNHPTCYAEDAFRVDGRVSGPAPTPAVTEAPAAGSASPGVETPAPSAVLPSEPTGAPSFASAGGR